ncbi:hypothetical protein FM037_02940 [Shewanella psychropiezotolerans]|uniref:SPOR domain-containing protein n=1 Tax=Shewanella psychropiezotolerans TaxID=2593655 RepID=A0ABX5WW40_9GAMM|nr:hypothetical protein [Shewanella psychropiezotolerans]QDO82387.1 hypothetical protein FM037_02940 [Shewanella psychropiezotolerans]
MSEELRLTAELEKIRAERDKFIVEGESFVSERKRYEAEINEINHRLNQPWYKIRLVSVLQAVIAGIVAGGLIWSFSIDHVKRLYDLQKHLSSVQAQLTKENNGLQKQIKQLGEDKVELLKEIELVGKIVQISASTVADSNVKASASVQLSNLSRVQLNLVPDDDANWFPVVASAYNKADLEGRLQEIKSLNPTFNVEIYNSSDKNGIPVYAITLGGYLSKNESMKRVQYAKEKNIAKDSYNWRTEKWGEDMYLELKEIPNK